MKQIAKTIISGIILLFSLTVSAIAAPNQRFALLVGVGQYQNASEQLHNLKGPPQDVDALAQILETHWGFDQVSVLKDQYATRDNILKALDHLVRTTPSGSHVLFYYSGHGTSPQDPKSGLPLPHTTGALLAHDSRWRGDNQTVIQSLLIGRRDLRPRFEAFDRKNIYLTAWIDACYAENSTRSIANASHRAAPRLNIPADEWGTGSVGYEAYPYPNASTFAASAANQTALDIDDRTLEIYPTLDGRYHGAFSDALLRALNHRALNDYGSLDKNSDHTISIEEFSAGVTAFMASRDYGHTPKLQPNSLEDRNKIRDRPLFYTQNQPQPSQKPTSVPISPTALKVTFSGTIEQRRQLAKLPALMLVERDAKISVTLQGTDYILSDGTGAEIGRIDSFATLQEALRRRALLEQLLSRIQQKSKATVSLELTNEWMTNRLPIGNRDHCVTVQLALKADHNGYPLVIDLFPDGTVQWLYPQGQQEWKQSWSAGQAKRLPAFKTTPPTGIDTVYTFLLNRPLASSLMSNASSILPMNGGRFDELMTALEQSVLGVNRLALEIYQARSSELQAWSKECAKQ